MVLKVKDSLKILLISNNNKYTVQQLIYCLVQFFFKFPNKKYMYQWFIKIYVNENLGFMTFKESIVTYKKIKIHMEWILYTIFLVHIYIYIHIHTHSLKHTAVILVSPDEDFWDGSQGFHQQTSVTLSHSLILAQQTMEISIKRADRCTWIISGNHAPHSVLLSTYINLEKKI